MKRWGFLAKSNTAALVGVPLLSSRRCARTCSGVALLSRGNPRDCRARLRNQAIFSSDKSAMVVSADETCAMVGAPLVERKPVFLRAYADS